jgi:hypothetical protein
LTSEELAAVTAATRAVVAEREAPMRDRIAALESKSVALPATLGNVKSGTADELLDAIDGLLRRTLAPLVKRIEELERTPFSYEGPHEQGKSYRKGAFVSHNGSLWHADVDGVMHRPGDGGGWKLAVKSGRDAR